MEYIYYDPPLKEPNAFDPGDDRRASLEDIKRIEDESWANYDGHLAHIDYALRFGVDPDLGGYIDGPDWYRMALLHGGATAVLLECLKRNVTITKLWKLNEPNGPLAEFLTHPYYRHLPTKELLQRLIDSVDRPFTGSYEENIARLKRQREEILELRRKRQQSQ